jgi:hypothetical protein
MKHHHGSLIFLAPRTSTLFFFVSQKVVAKGPSACTLGLLQRFATPFADSEPLSFFFDDVVVIPYITSHSRSRGSAILALGWLDAIAKIGRETNRMFLFDNAR